MAGWLMSGKIHEDLMGKSLDWFQGFFSPDTPILNGKNHVKTMVSGEKNPENQSNE